MRSIAVTKPDMGVLPRERVLLSPFGMLAQAFAQDVLARAEQREGLWPFLPLELLEEGGESAPPAAPAPVNLQVDLRLALEALRREGGETQQERAAQRIVERVIQMHSLHTAPGTGQDGKKDRRPGGGEHPRRGAAGLLPEPHPTHLHHPHPSSPGLPVPGRVCPGFGGAALEKSAPVAADRGEGGAGPPPGSGERAGSRRIFHLSRVRRPARPFPAFSRPAGHPRSRRRSWRSRRSVGIRERGAGWRRC